jgi:tetratricopeptide (TPR) repeat protein
VDNQTRQVLKKDKFAQATANSVSWLSGHRSGAMRWTIIAVVALIVVVGALVCRSLRSSAADAALGAALDTYDAQLAQPGVSATNGVYATANDRSKAANQQFVAIAKQYGWLPAGAKAHYMAGVTYADLGQSGQAETELKTAAGSWDRNLSNLAKMALAGLYHRTNRDSQAIELYNAVAAKPSDTVPTAMAQLNLADLYAANGKLDQARALWAKVKDADKNGVAGSIASQKLDAKQ